MMAYKGRDAENELTAAEGAIRKLGGSFENMIPTLLDREGDEHKLLLIKKQALPGRNIQEKAGTPAKEPFKIAFLSGFLRNKTHEPFGKCYDFPIERVRHRWIKRKKDFFG